MSNSKKSSRKSNRKLRQLIILAILILIIGGGYYYLRVYTYEPPVTVNNLSDSPQYTLLENKDTLKNKAIVLYHSNVSINTIAETFYKSHIFWPYIYIENKQVIHNPLNIDAEIVLRIPNIPSRLLDTQDTASMNRVKHMADSILNSVTQPI